jgi:hypothetical protein
MAQEKIKIGAVWGNEYGHTIIPCNGLPRITHQTDGHSLEVVGKKETLIYSVPLVACYTEMNLISIEIFMEITQNKDFEQIII